MSMGWKRPARVALICGVLFVALLVAAYALPFGRWADGWAVEGFLKLQRPWLTRVAFHVAHLATPVPFALWPVALASVALLRRRPRQALAIVVMLVAANVTAQMLKDVLAYERFHS